MEKHTTGRLKNWWVWVGQSVYFSFMSLLFTWPLATKLGTHVAGSPGDNLYFIWQIGWFKQAIFDLGQLPHHSHLLNFPDGYHLAISEIAPLQLTFGLPFALTDHLVLGYNVSMLLTFVLAGLFMSAWVSALTRSHWAGLVVGSAYAFLPYHIAHFLSGHLNISAIQWFPLYFWGFFDILRSQGKHKQRWLLLAAGLSGIALSSQYYLYGTLFISALLFLIYLFFIRRDCWRDRLMWQDFLWGGMLALPALLVGIVPYIMVHRSGSTQRTLSDVMVFSASVTDFLLPSTRHFIFGKWIGRTFARDLWNEASLYVGLPISVLAGLGFVRRKENGLEHLLALLIIGVLISVVLAMGTNLTWDETALRLAQDSWLRSILPNKDGLILLPGYWLFEHFPYYDLMRAWMRWGIFAMLFMCAAAGMGLKWVLGRVKNSARLPLALGLLGLVLLDFGVSPNRLSEVKPREVDWWLAQQPAGGLVQLPYKQSFEEFSLYATLYNQKPLLGTIRTFPSNRFFRLDPLLKNFPDEVSVDALRMEGVRYIVLDERFFRVDQDFIARCEELGLVWRESLDGQSVFTIY